MGGDGGGFPFVSAKNLKVLYSIGQDKRHHCLNLASKLTDYEVLNYQNDNLFVK